MVDEILTIVLDGAIYASWLFIVALGLTFVFGVLKILNIAHGGIYALGAYATATLVPIFYSLGMPEQLVILAMLVSALAVAIVITPIMERGILPGRCVATMYDAAPIVDWRTSSRLPLGRTHMAMIALESFGPCTPFW